MDRHSLRRAASWVVQSTEWLVLVAFIAAFVPPVLLRRKSLTVVSFFNLLDGSWLVDVCYKAACGVWLGRDVAFTYGPLYQWLASAPSRRIGVSIGSILSTASLFPNLIVLLATFVSARLLLPEVSAWRRALLVLLAMGFWAPPNIRTSVCLLAFLLFVRLTGLVASRRSDAVLPAVGAAIICFVSFLISADAGLYSAAALLLCVAATAVANLKTPGAAPPLGMFLIVAIACLTLFVLLTNVAMFSLLDFTYWKSSLTIAGAYRWFEAAGMAKLSKRWTLGILISGIAVFGTAGWRRDVGGNRWSRRPAFLLAGFCFAFLMMQSGLVRSDEPHVLIGLYPMIFLCAALLIAEQIPAWRSVISLSIVVAGTAALVWNYPKLLPTELFKSPHWRHRPVLACPGGYQQFDRACFTPDRTQLFATVATYVDQHTKSSDPILVFPYQNAFGIASRRNVAGGVVQAYLVNGDYLTNLDLAGLRKASPPFGLYFPDGTYSVALDGVPSFTRSPGLWFYLLRHYRLQGSPMPGVLGLLRDDDREQQLAATEEDIAAPLGTTKLARRSTVLDLGALRWPLTGADFLKIRALVNYPVWWKMRKPSALSVQMSFADGSEKTIQFVLQPGRDSDVWIYPWDEKQIGGYFSSEESEWPRGNRPAIARIKLLVTPFDWISVVPNSVTVSSVRAVRMAWTK